MRVTLYYITILLLAAIVQSCESSQSSGEESWPVSQQFSDYWYQGKAEISSYKLEQARYGALNEGSAVLIFVTEDFSQEKHVKLDNPDQAGDDAVKVMKLNFVKKFDTGIYPYSMMSSVFSPVNMQTYPDALKVTTSSQEWCGHTFTQLDLAGNAYDVQLFSYFESEGDQQLQVENKILEDELWNKIRLNPADLPTGNIEIVPGTTYQRLSHDPLQLQAAEASLEEQGEISVYTLEYPDLSRTLVIQFNTDFPHKIISWEETYPSGFGENKQMLTTTATLDETIMTDYWTKNTPADSVYRKELNLN